MFLIKIFYNFAKEVPIFTNFMIYPDSIADISLFFNQKTVIMW